MMIKEMVEKYFHTKPVFSVVICFMCGLLGSWITTGVEAATEPGVRGELRIRMPHVETSKPETYLCTPLQMDPGTNHYIVGFLPNATMHVAHHMLLFGCSSPGVQENVWDCGEMGTSRQKELSHASPCVKHSQIIYAWAREAPNLQLPPDVGFHVGGDSPIKYLVLQVHYANAIHRGHTDESGVVLKYTTVPQPKSAGVYILGTINGSIAGKSTEHFETACTIKEDKVLHPFAFRTHTHSLGTVVSGYRVRRNLEGMDQWSSIGKRSPQEAQMFYPVNDISLTIIYGDVLATRCTMVSDRTRPTNIGYTNADEMCVFYVMYWVQGREALTQNYCVSVGPPLYYWDKGVPVLNNIPSGDESST